MAVKIKTNQLAGYENTAFNYRFLNTTLTPLDILAEALKSTQKYHTLGRKVLDSFGAEFSAVDYPEYMTWTGELVNYGRDYDRTYRLLADEYYRTEEP